MDGACGGRWTMDDRRWGLSSRYPYPHRPSSIVHCPPARRLPMIADIRGYVDAFAGLKVLVIGEAMLDSYLVGSADRICREAPVPVVALSGRKDGPGGAANTAANAGSLGAEV